MSGSIVIGVAMGDGMPNMMVEKGVIPASVTGPVKWTRGWEEVGSRGGDTCRHRTFAQPYFRTGAIRENLAANPVRKLGDIPLGAVMRIVSKVSKACDGGIPCLSDKKRTRYPVMRKYHPQKDGLSSIIQP